MTYRRLLTLTGDCQVPQGTEGCMLHCNVPLLNMSVQQVQQHLHNPCVYHVDAIPI